MVLNLIKEQILIEIMRFSPAILSASHIVVVELKSVKAGEYSKQLSKSYGWLHGLATVCRGFLFDTSDLVLSRKIWLVSEMIDQEVVEQSAVSKQAPDNIPVRDSIILFPKTLFQGKAMAI